MPEGTLLYRTSGNNKLYGYNTNELLKIHPFKKDKIELNCGHVGIYVGKDKDGVDYVVEAVNNGIQKTPAKYFVNTSAGEKFIGARIPNNVTEKQRKKAVILAKNLAEQRLKYDFDFRTQKGPGNEQFICVGLTEKLYESADINIKGHNLVYTPANYAINITPDGYDNNSVYNAKTGDCFAANVEYSKISRRASMGEIIGTNCGKESNGQRYFFLPHTQFLQPSLKDVQADILISSDFSGSKIRGLTPAGKIILSWTRNNTVSSTKIAAQKVKNTGSKVAIGWQNIIKGYQNLTQNVFTPVVEQQAGDEQGKILSAQESNFSIPTTITAEDLFKPKQAGSAGRQEINKELGFTDSEPSSLLTEAKSVSNKHPTADTIFKAKKTAPLTRKAKDEQALLDAKLSNKAKGGVGVARVIDGDTIELTTGEKVRYIGIDTPELGRPGPDDDECLAWVARLRNMQLLGTGKLALIKDPAADKDKYGRLLRYVYSGDIFINQQLAREGLAKTFFCKPGWKNCPVIADKRQEQIIMSAADSAKQNKRGLFSMVCQQQLVKNDNIIKGRTDNKNLFQPKEEDSLTDDGSQKITPTQRPASFIFVAGGDTVAPITTITDKPTNPTNLSLAEFSFIANEQAVFSCKLGDGEWQDCSSPVSYSNLDSGEHIFKVQATDQAGNVELNPVEYIWEIDLTIPSAPIILWPSEFPYYASSTPIIINGSNDSGLEVLINNSTTGVEIIDNTNWQSSLGLAEGENIFYIKSIDQFGAESGEDEFTIILDTIAPTIAIDSGPDNFASSTVAEFEFRADEEGLSYQCQLDSGGWHACSASPIGYEESSNRASTTISNLTEDEHNLEAKAIDQVGNISNTLAHHWLVDLTAPTSTMQSLDDEYEQTGFTVSWSGSDASSTVETSGIASFDLQYKINNEEWQDWIIATTSASTVFSIDVSAGNDIYFRVRARDNAGNVGEWSEAAQTSIANNLADHIVISEIATRGPNGAYDEFVELYNPTEQAFNLQGWKLQTKSASGASWSNRTGGSGLPDSIISAKGYYLVSAKNYSLSAIPDYYHSANWGLADGGGHARIVNSQDEEIDKVGYGDAQDPEWLAVQADLSNSSSLERKANQNGGSTSMINGVDQWQGNGYDTDDNSQDFIIRDSPDPQNSSSPTEPRDSAPTIPDSINDLAVQNIYTTANSVKLRWTSPDSANLGSVAYYDLRYQEKDGDCNLYLAWNNASQVSTSSLPTPSNTAGQNQIAEIIGLSPNTEYCFAIRTYNGGYWSGLSNQVCGTTLSESVNSITVDGTTHYNMVHTGYITWGHTITGEDRALIVIAYWHDNNKRAENVTFNDINLTKVVAEVNHYTGVNNSIWYLANPPLGAYNITIQFTAGMVVAASAISLNNCNVDDLINNTYHRYAQSVYIENTITVGGNNSIIIDAMSVDCSTGSLTADDGQTEFFNNTIGGCCSEHVGSSYKLVSSAGDYQMGWTQSWYNTWAHSIVAINAKP
ncbi:MAG: lamin tail domain-containing protein [Patescibacteria group bacterium]|nr:lamin tail domain-containing protein [Patescibacteria group bacterium]